MTESPRELIKRHAIRLFAHNSFTGTSVREIAKAADVNIAAINYYFGSKEGLLESLFKEFSANQQSKLTGVLQAPNSVDEFRDRLREFVRRFFQLALAERDYFEMAYQNLNLFERISPDEFRKTFGMICNAIIAFFEAGQRKGFIRREIDSEMALRLFMGPLSDAVRNRRIGSTLFGSSIEDEGFREKYVETIVDCYIFGVISNE